MTCADCKGTRTVFSFSLGKIVACPWCYGSGIIPSEGNITQEKDDQIKLLLSIISRMAPGYAKYLDEFGVDGGTPDEVVYREALAAIQTS